MNHEQPHSLRNPFRTTERNCRAICAAYARTMSPELFRLQANWRSRMFDAIFATRLLRALVFQVDALDLPVLAFAVAAILLIALGASVVPARRAAAADPLDALR